MGARAAIFGTGGPVLDRAERAFFRDADPWGFILFARNVEAPDQLRRLTANLRDAVGRDAPILIDQEGGRVARLTPPHWTGWENALSFMDRLTPGERDEAMRLRYQIIGAELAAVGIDVNCAPLADLPQPDMHPRLRERCYGTTPEAVAARGRAVADGLLAAGVLPVLKHMPGHGRATVDSHAHLPRVDAPLGELEATDFAPFRALADLPLGMTAHIVFDAIDPARPATQSPDVIGLIRDHIGFGGALMTDDLNMFALSGPMTQKVDAAMTAGCDLALHCNGNMGEMREVAAATPRLSGAALDRCDAALAARPAASVSARDIPELRARLDTVTMEVGHA